MFCIQSCFTVNVIPNFRCVHLKCKNTLNEFRIAFNTCFYKRFSNDMFVACLAILATLPGCCSEPKTKYICKLEISLVCRVCLQGKFACRNLLRFVENFYNYAIFFKAVVLKIGLFCFQNLNTFLQLVQFCQ